MLLLLLALVATLHAMPRVAVCVSGQLRTLTLAPDAPLHHRSWGPMRVRAGALPPRPLMSVAESVQRSLFAPLAALGYAVDVFMLVESEAAACEPLRPPAPGRLFCRVARDAPLPDMPRAFRRAFVYGGTERYVQGLLQQLHGQRECNRARRAEGPHAWVVRTRPDLYVHTFPSRLPDEEDTVWFANNVTCCCGNEDSFGLGRPRAMDLYLDRLSQLMSGDDGGLRNSSAFLAGPGHWTSETYLVRLLGDHGVALRPHAELQACLVKPRSRHSPSDP